MNETKSVKPDWTRLRLHGEQVKLSLYLTVSALQVQTDHPEDQNELTPDRDRPQSLPPSTCLTLPVSLSLSLLSESSASSLHNTTWINPQRLPARLSSPLSASIGLSYCFVVVLQRRIPSRRPCAPGHTRPEPAADGNTQIICQP